MVRPPRPRRARAAPQLVRSLLVALAALAAPSASPAQQQPRPGEVRLFVTVTDERGRHLAGLDRSHFSIFEGKDARPVTSFDAADAPVSVVVLVDVSGSMRAWDDERKAALGRLFLKGHPENQYSVVEFSDRGRMLADWTGDPARLADALGRIGAARGGKGAHGQTALYDACAYGLDKLSSAPHAKRVLVVVSDGMDNRSHMSFRELRRRIQESDALVYSVGLGERMNPGIWDVAARALLTELSVPTGGAAFFPEGRKELAAAAEWIAVELRQQYAVGFAPGEAAAGAKRGPEWRKIKIKVAPPSNEIKKVVARARHGYFFPRAGG